jgi:hypothetical protein
MNEYLLTRLDKFGQIFLLGSITVTSTTGPYAAEAFNVDSMYRNMWHHTIRNCIYETAHCTAPLPCA